MNGFRNRLNSEGGYAGIIALLVVVAIGFVLYFTVIGPKMSSREDKTRQEAGQMGVNLDENKTLAGAAMDKGKETSCKAQLDQIRQGIVMYKTENEGNPPSLESLNLSMAPSHFACPAGNEPYSYDPNTAAVRCVHPGHEGL